MQIYRFSIAILFLLLTVSSTEKSENIIQKELTSNINTTAKRVQYINNQLNKSDNRLSFEFENLRVQLQKIRWVFPKYFSLDEIEKINNSKYWVLNDAIEEQSYPEAGIFQILEKNVYKKHVDVVTTSKSLKNLGIILNLLLEKIRENPLTDDDIVPLIYLSVQEQYLLQLTGYERINTNKVNQELQSALVFYEHLPLPTDTKKQIKILSYQFKSTFEEINRFEIYQNHYLPLLRKLRASFPTQIPVYLKTQTGQSLTESNIFLDNFLNPNFYTDNKAEPDSQVNSLGRLLFFEPLFSLNNKRSCASCHKPQKAFSDGRQVSIAFNMSERLSRNSPTLLNSVFNQYFSHDLSKKSLEGQILSVVHNSKEFNSNLSVGIDKLNNSSHYKQLFQKSFPNNPTIDSTNILKALVGYISTLKSNDSKFDESINKTSIVNEEIKQGYNLFMGKAGCGSCHFAPLFSGLKPPFFQRNEYHSLSIPQSLMKGSDVDSDVGIANSGLSKFNDNRYNHFFKTPSLRNLKYTEPLMHNGILIRLDEALKFHTSANKLKQPRTYPNQGIKLNENEMKHIIAFLGNLDTEHPEKKFIEPDSLPQIDGTNHKLNSRRPGGVY